MKRLYSTYLLLLSCVSLYAQATESCTQLPMPDVLAKMIVESVSLDEYNSDADCYDIQFRECNTLADMLGRGQDEEAGYPVEELINQLETNSKGYIFYSDLGDDAHKSPRHFMRKKRVKLPARVVSVCISSSTEDEVLSDCKSDSIQPEIEVNNFDDIGRYLSHKSIRHIYASSRCPRCGESPKIRYECIDKFYNRFGNVIDSLDLIDYSCDTVCIRMSGNPAAPYADPDVRLYCKKGLYEINDFTLTPIIYPEEYCGEKRRTQDEEMRKRYEPNLDAWPMSYDWEMMLYQCYDEDKLYKNHGGFVAEFYCILTRVIIKDNSIVYCDRWIW